ncbi:MAG: 50S ribosomal protein L18 [Armatimonadetes bacterium]|nr:50S ribosomal protein L18 [Armatimonadota bacterium]
MATRTRSDMRKLRHERIRKHITGTTEVPRLAVFRSEKHISAQIIDDSTGRTLAAAGTTQKDLKGNANKVTARKVGETLGKRAKEAGVTKVVFDRGGYRYHGRVAELAEGARSAGLEF